MFEIMSKQCNTRDQFFCVFVLCPCSFVSCSSSRFRASILFQSCPFTCESCLFTCRLFHLLPFNCESCSFTCESCLFTCQSHQQFLYLLQLSSLHSLYILMCRFFGYTTVMSKQQLQTSRVSGVMGEYRCFQKGVQYLHDISNSYVSFQSDILPNLIAFVRGSPVLPCKRKQNDLEIFLGEYQDQGSYIFVG